MTEKGPPQPGADGTGPPTSAASEVPHEGRPVEGAEGATSEAAPLDTSPVRSDDRLGGPVTGVALLLLVAVLLFLTREALRRDSA